MAEFTSTIQQVAAGQNAILDTDVIKSRCVSHRTGSGLICVESYLAVHASPAMVSVLKTL